MSRRLQFTVPFQNPTESLLRNGLLKTSGLVATDLAEGEVLLKVLNSRGEWATGFITVDTDALPEVIKALVQIYLDNRPADEPLLRDRIEAGIVLSRAPVPDEDVDALDEADGPRL